MAGEQVPNCRTRHSLRTGIAELVQHYIGDIITKAIAEDVCCRRIGIVPDGECVLGGEFAFARFAPSVTASSPYRLIIRLATLKFEFANSIRPFSSRGPQHGFNATCDER